MQPICYNQNYRQQYKKVPLMDRTLSFYYSTLDLVLRNTVTDINSFPIPKF